MKTTDSFFEGRLEEAGASYLTSAQIGPAWMGFRVFNAGPRDKSKAPKDPQNIAGIVEKSERAALRKLKAIAKETGEYVWTQKGNRSK